MNLILKIQELTGVMGGVFTYADLSNLIGEPSKLQTIRALHDLVRENILFKIQRGFYTTANPDLWVLACRIKVNAYISMESVLAKNGLIGTIPQRIVSAVYPGQRRKVIRTPFGLLRFFKIKRSLIFGTTRIQQGVWIADSEKAYLDLLYYYLKGVRFVIDPLQEVNLKKLNHSKIEKYLQQYQNPKFVEFVRREIR